jgi:hypothetical protein
LPSSLGADPGLLGRPGRGLHLGAGGQGSADLVGGCDHRHLAQAGGQVAAGHATHPRGARALAERGVKAGAQVGSIAAVAAAHLAAGADHVILMSSSSASNADLMTCVGQLEQLTPAVL